MRSAGVVAKLEATTDTAVMEADAANTADAVESKPQLRMLILSQIQMLVMPKMALSFHPDPQLDLTCSLVIIKLAPWAKSPIQITQRLNPCAT
jgi:hypothetical protein